MHNIKFNQNENNNFIYDFLNPLIYNLLSLNASPILVSGFSAKMYGAN